VSRALPSTALGEVLRDAFEGRTGPAVAWLVLAVWAVVAPALAVRLFRWE
jgi:hypothetical protein